MMRIYPVRALASAVALAGCGDKATLPQQAGYGPHPSLPAPNPTMIPTINQADAVGWPAGTKPVAGPGLTVSAFATGLDHSRWIYVLPNGDVLVAETNAPTRPDDGKGPKAWVQRQLMKKAAAQTPSADRITLLRDTDGDAIADQKSVF